MVILIYVSMFEVKGWCVMFFVEVVVVMIGNLFIMIVFVKVCDMRRKYGYYFFMNLVLVDFMVGVFVELLFGYILGGYYDLWIFKYKDILFIVSIFFDMFFGILLIVFFVVIVFERFYVMLYLIRYRVIRIVSYIVVIFLLWVIFVIILSI